MDSPGERLTRTRLGARLLREELRRDDPLRERAVVRFSLGVIAASAIATAALSGALGRSLTVAMFGMLAVLAAYYGLVLYLLARRGLHPLMQWTNVAIEVSVPAVIMVLDVQFKGPEYAITAPPLLLWGALIVLSGLRARRALALCAGVLAAVELVAVYALRVHPLLPPDVLETMTYPFVLLRGAFLVFTGAATAVIAHHLIGRAETTLVAIRERDWMGKYFLHERIGVGGMAEVFRATYCPEGGFEKQVAIKRILPAFAEDEEFVALFRREAEIGAMLAHPNVVQVLDLGRHQGSLFLALELVEGVSLAQLLADGRRLSLPAVLFLAAEIAAALEYLHGKAAPDGTPIGLVHRDLNPPNILVSRAGEVKLSDFGVTRARGGRKVTVAGMNRGKPGYMAPEQALGEELDHRVDLFALGLTLYEALTNVPAFEGDDDRELLAAAVAEEVPPPAVRRPEVPRELDALVTSLMAKRREDRPASGAEVLRQLHRAFGAELPAGKVQLVQAVEELRAARSAATV